MEAVWNALAAQSDEGGPAGQLRRFEASAGGILDELKGLEARALAETEPLSFLRRSLADRVDRRIATALMRRFGLGPASPGAADGPAQSLDLVIADLDVQIAVLREYCRRRFGDGLETGWFAAYQRLSTLFHERMQAGRRTEAGEGFRFDGRAWRFTRADFQACRRRCLAAGVDETFAPIDRIDGD